MLLHASRSSDTRSARGFVLAALLASALVGALGCQTRSALPPAPRAAPGQERPALETVLARVRAAVGSEAYARSGEPVALVGEALALGLEARGSLGFAPGGAFLVSVRGPLSTSIGYDGTLAWTTDYDGSTRTLALEEHDEALFEQWLLTGHWLDPRSRIGVSWAEQDRDGTLLRLVLADGPMDGTLRLDPGTWLPAELVRRTSAGTKTWTYADWRDVGKLRVPFDVRAVDAAGNASGMRWSSVSKPPTFVRSPYARPRGLPADTAFDAQAPAEIEVQRTRTGHLLVHPLVDGEEVGWFILDTGAGGMCIDRRAAESLELEALGEVLAVGVAGSETTRFRRAASFRLGPMRYEQPIFVELDLSFLEEVFGEEIGGIVGYDFFARCAVELEVESGRTRIFDPTGYALERGEWQHLLTDGRTPTVEARFEGHQGFFRLDTGAGSGTVTFHTPAVARLGLLEGRELEAAAHGGVGGTARSFAGTLEWFEIGGNRFERPLVEFATTEVGGMADRYTAGNLGQGFLHSFRLVLDYPHERFALVPLADEAPSAR